MKKIVQAHGYLKTDQRYKIADIGSQDVSSPTDPHLISGTYRPLFTSSPLWEYIGIDIVAGRNVDIVVPTIPWPVLDNSMDVVISGQTLEHTKAPWLWIKEIERICKPGGLVLLIAPWKWEEHRYPVDCWRILSDGMNYLLGEWCNFEIMMIGTQTKDVGHGDCFAIGRRRDEPNK